MHRFEPTGSQMEADSFAYRSVHLQKLQITSLDYFAGKAHFLLEHFQNLYLRYLLTDFNLLKMKL